MKGKVGDRKSPDEDYRPRADSPEIAERAQRLRAAVKAAGGNRAVAARSGVVLGTLNNYLAGRDMKAGNMIALAHACGVRLDWLATGQEPREIGASLPKPGAADAATTPGKQAREALFATVNVDALAAAFETASEGFAKRRLKPSSRRLVQLALLLYDAVYGVEGEPGDENDAARLVESLAFRDHN